MFRTERTETREKSVGWGNRDLEAEPGSVNSPRCELPSSGLGFPCGSLRWAGVGNKIRWYYQSHSFPYSCLVRQAGQEVFGGFPGGSVIMNPPLVQETGAQSLVWEDLTGHRATKPMCHNY